MPRKRRSGKARVALTLDDLSFAELHAFCYGGWSPEQRPFLRRDVRFESWEEFDAAYEHLRDQRDSDLWFYRDGPRFAEARYLAARNGG
jgi:hypothetical protein